MASLPIVGPAAARALADAPAGANPKRYAGYKGAPGDQCEANEACDWAKDNEAEEFDAVAHRAKRLADKFNERLNLLSPDYYQYRLEEIRRQGIGSYLDPDLAANKSFSLATKYRIQAERFATRQIEEELRNVETSIWSLENPDGNKMAHWQMRMQAAKRMFGIG